MLEDNEPESCTLRKDCESISDPCDLVHGVRTCTVHDGHVHRLVHVVLHACVACVGVEKEGGGEFKETCDRENGGCELAFSMAERGSRHGTGSRNVSSAIKPGSTEGREASAESECKASVLGSEDSVLGTGRDEDKDWRARRA